MKDNLTAENLINFRNLYGLTYQELGELIDPSANHKTITMKISKWEKGDTEIPAIISTALLGVEVKLKEKQLKKPQKRRKSEFKFIDLFAGIGGMRLGFERAGGECVFTSEYDKYPAKVYEDNFEEKPAGDITKIKETDIPPHDVLVAGFPCQPFSIAGVSKKNSMGRAHGFECDTQGTLFFDVARIIKHHRPSMFLLENVKNLLSHDKGNTFRVILRALQEELGYKVFYKIIDGKNCVPQHRERIYIVGTLDHDSDFKWPVFKKDSNHTLDEILFQNNQVDPKYTLSDKLWSSLQRHADKHKAKGNGFGFGLCNRNMTARTLSARYYKDGSEILIEQKGKNPRRLTPRECAKLMGFDDTFKITVSDTRAYKCFGNSVVVPVIEAIAKQMAKTKIMKEVAKNKSWTTHQLQ